MRQILKMATATILAITASALPASAQFVQRTNRPASAFTQQWTPVSMSPTTVNGGVTATTTGGDWYGDMIVGIDWDGGFTDGENLLFGFGNNVITLDFANTINAFGTQAWYNSALGGNISLMAYFQGNLIGSFSQAVGGGASPNLNQAEVFAFTSSVGIDRVVLSGSDEFAINQLGADVSVVPEPSTVALLSVGMLVLGGAERRRRTRKQ